ncbi:hypothetical protein ACFRH6_10885 [Streptomyces sp. NPDC056749]|uniref:hypothetical protein n=1 Tax=Streptomyces sp. NPDC056749 TaxID=3345936 RepID=UPI0036CC0D9B
MTRPRGATGIGLTSTQENAESAARRSGADHVVVSTGNASVATVVSTGNALVATVVELTGATKASDVRSAAAARPPSGRRRASTGVVRRHGRPFHLGTFKGAVPAPSTRER